MRHLFLAALLVSVLGGCASDGEIQRFDKRVLTRISPWSDPATDPRYAGLERAQARTMSMTDASGNRTVLRHLARSTAGVETWLGPEGTGYSFRDGVLVATRGTGSDIMSSDVSDLLALIRHGGEGTTERFVTTLDGENQVQYHSYVCTVTSSIAPGGHEVLEDCAGLTRNFVNRYVVSSSSGKIVQSRQNLGAEGAMAIFGETS